MKLEFHKAEKTSGVIKATIHRSGRLGFSKEAEKYLELDKAICISIASDSDDETVVDIYLKIHRENIDGGFQLKKAGDYYFLDTKNLFNKLGVDFRDSKKVIIFDIIHVMYDDEMIYKLRRR